MTDIEAARESLAAALESSGYGVAIRNRLWIINERGTGKKIGCHPAPNTVEEIYRLYRRYLA